MDSISRMRSRTFVVQVRVFLQVMSCTGPPTHCQLCHLYLYMLKYLQPNAHSLGMKMKMTRRMVVEIKTQVLPSLAMAVTLMMTLS